MRHATGLKRSGWRAAAALVAGVLLSPAALAGPAAAPSDSAPGPVILSVPPAPAQAPAPRKVEQPGPPRYFPKSRSDVPVPPRRDVPSDPAPADDAAHSGPPAPAVQPASEPAAPAAPAAAAPPVSAAQSLGTSRVMQVGTQGGGAVGLKTYPQSLPLNDHEVVLTFDDGPWPVTTARVLDVLKANGVKATFFLVGKNAAAHPELVRRESEEGHTVAHHSWSHPAITLRGLSETEAQAEIDRGIEADERALGGDGGPNRIRVPFFRFPGFADTHDLVAGLAKRNIVVFGADLWASDWLLMTPEAQLRLTMKRLHEAGKGIVLFHDTRPQTAAMLQDFLTMLKQDGFRIVHIVPGPGPLETSPAPPGWSSETEASLVKIMPRLLAGQRSASPKPEKGQAPLPAMPSMPAALPTTEPGAAP